MNRIDQPVPGFYRTRLARGGVWVPVRIWFGPPVVDRRRLDRSPRWQAVVNGLIEPDVFKVWPFCADAPITLYEYRFLLKREAWARRHAPEHPVANPRAPIDLRKLKPAW